MINTYLRFRVMKGEAEYLLKKIKKKINTYRSRGRPLQRDSFNFNRVTKR